MKARKLFFLVALVAMVMALTSCAGIAADKQGVWAPVKVIYTKADGTVITETINWNNNTFETTAQSNGWCNSKAYWFCDIFNAGKSKAKLAQAMSDAEFAAADGVKNIPWYAADHDREMKVEGNNVIFGTKASFVFLEDLKLEPSDDTDIGAWVYNHTFSDGDTIKAYYSIFK